MDENSTVETNSEDYEKVFEDVEVGNDPENKEEPLDEFYDEIPSEADDDDDSEEDNSDDEESDEEEGEETSDTDDEPSQEQEAIQETPVSQNPVAGNDNTGNAQEQLTPRQKLVRELANELEAEDIPTTPEFRKSAISEAKKAVCKELNIDEDDFNNFDEEHQFLFSEKLEQIRSEKKQKFDYAVNRIQRKQAEEERAANIKNLVESQCNTPEKKQKLYQVIRGASTGYTEDMKAELLQGKTDKLQKLIDVATGKRSLPTPKKKSVKNTKTGRDRGYASDLVFGFN